MHELIMILLLICTFSNAAPEGLILQSQEVSLNLPNENIVVFAWQISAPSHLFSIRHNFSLLGLCTWVPNDFSISASNLLYSVIQQSPQWEFLWISWYSL